MLILIILATAYAIGNIQALTIDKICGKYHGDIILIDGVYQCIDNLTR